MRLAFNGIATLELFMNIKINTLSIILLSTLITGCANEENSPFGPNSSGAASSTNIITDINFSVGASESNPAVHDDDGYHGGIEVTLTARAGDKDNLSVTSGTVYFRSEYGILTPNFCELDSTGTCSVTWTSILENIPGDDLADITVYTLGEESYFDVDGSGTFNDGDTQITDTDEPYVNYNGTIGAVDVFNIGVDLPIDLDGSGATGAAHTPADGKISVAGCSHSTLCATSSSIIIYDQMTLDLYTGT